jgi:predicted  nucleic acid-binding Zn-ribbon protein
MEDKKDFEPTVIELLSALTSTVDRIELGQFDLTERVGRLEVGQTQLRANLSEVKDDLNGVKGEVNGLKHEVHGLNGRMDSLEETFADYATAMDERVLILEKR